MVFRESFFVGGQMVVKEESTFILKNAIRFQTYLILESYRYQFPSLIRILLISLIKKSWKDSNRQVHHCREVRFASFLSGGFTTMVVISPLERKLAKHTSVHWPKKTFKAPLCLYNFECTLELNVLQIQNHMVHTHGFSLQHTKVGIS